MKAALSPVQGLKHAFLTAAQVGDLKKVQDLIEQGCSVNTKDQVKCTVAHTQSLTNVACFVYNMVSPPHTRMHHHHSVCHLHSHRNLCTWLLHCEYKVHMSDYFLSFIINLDKVHGIPVLCSLVMFSLFIEWAQCPTPCCRGWPCECHPPLGAHNEVPA